MDDVLKPALTYGTILAGSFSLGAYKGFNAAHGNDVSLAVDAALIGVPLASGAAAATIMSTNVRNYDIVTAAFSAFEGLVHGAAGGVGSALAEGFGMGVGYATGYFAR